MRGRDLSFVAMPRPLFRAPVSLFTNSVPSSRMVRSAEKLVSKMASKPIRLKAV